jgi:murein DD-endopeptidase MepM/ murein hydrolase activator NlpD
MPLPTQKNQKQRLTNRSSIQRIQNKAKKQLVITSMGLQKFGAVLAIATTILLSAIYIFASTVPAAALQVKITPTAPRLGDTLSVTAQYDNLETNMAPTVSMGNHTYQTFLVGPNQFRALMPTTPLDKPGTLQIRVEGGGETSNVAVKLGGRSFPTQSIWLPPGKDSDISDDEYNRVEAFKKLVTPQKFWNGPFLQPNQGPITGVYGIRRYYNGVFAKDYYHRGVDYAGAYGSPVIAPAAGQVALVGWEKDGFRVNGNIVGIDHGQGVTSAYLHLSRITVKQGDFVKAGQVIGAVGATGAATGPHLHWGLYVNGLSVDPAPWRKKGFE